MESSQEIKNAVEATKFEWLLIGVAIGYIIANTWNILMFVDRLFRI